MPRERGPPSEASDGKFSDTEDMSSEESHSAEWHVVERVHKRKRAEVPPVAPPESPDEPNFGPLVIADESDSDLEVTLKKKCSGSEPESN